MLKMQRYVSNELTHFVGRDEPDDEAKYALLVRILGTGILTNPQQDEGLHIKAKKFSENKMFNPKMVCFCDIPVDDFGIHMGKYSKFGLSFSKPFLVQKGASPVFYIAMNSVIQTWLHDENGGGEVEITRGDYFDQMSKENERLFWITQVGEAALRTGVTDEKLLWRDLHRFLAFQVFSFVIFFDEKKSDDDEKNFYMEREWRVLGSVKFDISDVSRIVLPGIYGERLRRDFPDYAGQITFV